MVNTINLPDFEIETDNEEQIEYVKNQLINIIDRKKFSEWLTRIKDGDKLKNEYYISDFHNSLIDWSNQE